MGIVIDLLLVAVMIFFIVYSAKKGFMITVLEVAAFALAIILSAELSKPFANTAYKLLFEPTVVKKITETLPENTSTATTAKKVSVVLDNLPDFAKNYISKTSSGTDDITKTILEGTFSGDNEAMAKQLNEKVAKPLSISILTPIMFLVLGVVLLFLLRAIAKGLNKFIKLPIVGAANTVLGGIFGLLKGAVLVYFLSILLSVLSVRMGENTGFFKAVSDSSIVAFVQSFNPIEILK